MVLATEKIEEKGNYLVYGINHLRLRHRATASSAPKVASAVRRQV